MLVIKMDNPNLIANASCNISHLNPKIPASCTQKTTQSIPATIAGWYGIVNCGEFPSETECAEGYGSAILEGSPR